MIPAVVALLSAALAVGLMVSAVWTEHERAVVPLVLVGAACIVLGIPISIALEGVEAPFLAEHATDFDTAPVCFRSVDVPLVRSAGEDHVPPGLFCCRQAGAMSCAIDNE